MPRHVTNVVLAGLGGQGVLKASDILAEAAFRAGRDVKKSHVRGMSQRGGPVTTDVRFGDEVFSPMVPDAEAHYLLVLDPGLVKANTHRLTERGILITPDGLRHAELPDLRCLNVALLGLLSTHLHIDDRHWIEAIRANTREKHRDMNLNAFRIGRRCPSRTVPPEPQAEARECGQSRPAPVK